MADTPDMNLSTMRVERDPDRSADVEKPSPARWMGGDRCSEYLREAIALTENQDG